jgi:8-oxo-dGTP pyrophosphatase MutT (NUDIX family)
VDSHPDAEGRRRAARVIPVAPSGRFLLLRGGDPARPGTHIWHFPGGGLEPGEDFPSAALREFAEETGHPVELGPPVWDRVLDFSFNHEDVRQYEVFFLGRVDEEFVPDDGGHNELESRYLTGHGWFTPEDLRRNRDLLAPPGVADLLDDLLQHGPPASLVRVGGAVLP